MQYIYPTINGIIQNTELIIKYKNKIEFITCDQLNFITNIIDDDSRKKKFMQYQILSNKGFTNIIDIKHEYIESDIYCITLNNGKKLFLTDYCTIIDKNIINLQINDSVIMANMPSNIHYNQYIDLLELLKDYKDIIYIKNYMLITNINSTINNQLQQLTEYNVIDNKLQADQSNMCIILDSITLDEYNILKQNNEIDESQAYVSLDNKYFLPVKFPLSNILGRFLGYMFKDKEHSVFVSPNNNIMHNMYLYLKNLFNINTVITKFLDNTYTTKYLLTINNPLILFILKSFISNYRLIDDLRFANTEFISNFLLGIIDNYFDYKFISSWDDKKLSIQELSITMESEKYIYTLIDILSLYNIYGEVIEDGYQDNNFLSNRYYNLYSLYLNKNNVNLLQELINYKSLNLDRLKLKNNTSFKSQIVNITQQFYKGYIYNIQTENNCFAANNIIISTV